MSKRESPIGFISILGATFGLSIAAIWLAYQFGLGSDSNLEYTYDTDINNTLVTSELNKSETAITPTLTPTPTPKKLKIADDITKNPVQVQVKFLVDSNRITSQGVETLDQLKKQAIEFDSQSVGIRIFSNPGESEFTQQIGRQRGEEIAGYLRYLGLKHKIVISKRIPEIPENQQSNQLLVVQLYQL
ncbi:hypothetical protein IQ247_24505 [Plectonema cf. radiosum LEGE 06105]|uniref:OmpA-like domain-containing protein n=2 Tax=Plectonema TaxID=1183 RepID=A0A8J7FLQ3_9CYAN|nr:hypothetical protein [Plectonema cf. radiosum LEGE 06105]